MPWGVLVSVCDDHGNGDGEYDCCCAAYLGRLDMVVEVVAEGLDVRDHVVHALRGEVPREQD